MAKQHFKEASMHAHTTDSRGSARDLMLRVDYRAVAELKLDPSNARSHTPKQIGQIADSIRQFGFTNPILIDGADMVMAGHGRLAAAKQLRMVTVPTLRLDHMSPAERRAYVVADNRLAELGGWDKGLLAATFSELEALDFDLNLTGFDLGDISIIMDGADGVVAEEDCPAPITGPAVSRRGDLWLLGPHRLSCGSALEKPVFERLMGEDRAAMVFTDPPFNVPIRGHVSGLGRNQHREFAMASGEMSEAEFTTFLRTAFAQMTAYAGDGSLHFICMDWRHMSEVLAAAKDVFSELKNLVVWNKDNGGMGSLYRSKHELVFVYKSGSKPHVNTVQLGRNGRNRTNVWDYPGQNTFHRDRDKDLADHPTVKPVALVADAIRDVSRRGDVVLDPFGGSGTTLIAAEKTGRTSRLIELDPHYVDVIIRRWQALTGESAHLADSGCSFDAAATARAATAEVIPFPAAAATKPPRARRAAKAAASRTHAQEGDRDDVA